MTKVIRITLLLLLAGVLFHFCSKDSVSSDEEAAVEIQVLPEIGTPGTAFTIQNIIVNDENISASNGYSYCVKWGEGNYESESWFDTLGVNFCYESKGRKKIEVEVKDSLGNRYEGYKYVYVVEVSQLVENTSNRNQMNCDLNRSGDVDRVAFEWYSPDSPVYCHAIWVSTFPEGEPTLLYREDNATIIFPEWSPDGSKIAFAHNGISQEPDKGLLIYDLNADTVQVTGLYTLYWNRWSPDGQWIIFYGRPDLSSEDRMILYDVLADTFTIMEQFEGPVSVAWSPDGSMLAYHYGISNIPDSTLYIMDFSSRSIIKEFTNLKRDQLGSKLDWSPDGNWISLGFNGNILNILNYNTGEIVKVRFDNFNLCWYPGWSKDGRLIAFEGCPKDQELLLSIWAFEFPY